MNHQRLLNLFTANGTRAAQALGLMLFTGAVFAQPQPEEFTVCRNGCPTLVLSGGNLLIGDSGTLPNHALLLPVDPVGDQLAIGLLNGLPSGRAADGSPFGPVAYALNGRNLYIAFGEADQFHSGGPSLINRAPLTPFVASVVQVTFSADPSNCGAFILRPADSQQLLNGQYVTLWDFSGNTATLRQIATLGPGAYPSALATLASLPNEVYVVDSGSNRLLAIDQTTFEVATVAQFPDKPESLRAFDDHQLLVTLFSPNPGGSSVFLLDPNQGSSHLVAGQLTTAVDAIPANTSAGSTFFVLENSSGSDGYGRLLAVNSSGTVAGVVAAGLNDPTSLAIDAFTRRIFISSRGDGVIYTVPLP